MSRGALHVDLEEVCKAFFAFFFFFLIFPFSLPDGSFDSHWKLIFSEPPLYLSGVPSRSSAAGVLLFHQPPTRVSSIIIIIIMGRWEDEEEEGRRR
jgi:hypothetical protein